MNANVLERLHEKLLAWYRAERRDLPWRRTRDPYAIWLSEIMLQQTRVETVIPYYERFLVEYPTVHALAEAPLDDVLAKWSGLGYYRRARALHAGAKLVSSEKKGRFPRTAELLREVPGIGPYTAGAVASIAFGEAAPLVDGNVARVLARVFEIEDDVKKGAGLARVWKIAAKLVPSDAAGDWNQALMELGATICAPQSPRCLLCPLRDDCRARSAGKTAAIPVASPKKAPREWKRTAVVVVRGDEVFLARRRGDKLFGGMWEPPAVDAGGEARATLRKMLGLAKGVEYIEKGEAMHVLSHRRMQVEVLAADASRAKLVPNDEYEHGEWVEMSSLSERAVSTLARKVLALGTTTPSPPPTARGRRRRSP